MKKDEERELLVKTAMREVGLVPYCEDAISVHYHVMGNSYYDIDYTENDTTSIRYDKLVKRLDAYIKRFNNGEEK